MAAGLADQLLAGAVALGGVEEVDAAVQRAREDALRGRGVFGGEAAYLHQADAQAADFEAGPSKGRHLHVGFLRVTHRDPLPKSSPNRGRDKKDPPLEALVSSPSGGGTKEGGPPSHSDCRR